MRQVTPSAISNLKFQMPPSPARDSYREKRTLETLVDAILIARDSHCAARKIAKRPVPPHTPRMSIGGSSLLLALLLASAPLHAASKYTMPDLDQEENTCFPAAASNVIYWLGENGYPKLLPPVVAGENRHRRLFNQLLVHCNVSYRFGTKFETMAKGLAAFFKEHGYDNVRISYQGFGGAPLSGTGWFEKNAQDNVGFILCIDYVNKKGEKEFADTESLGHCVSLLTYDNNVAVILDPAHDVGTRSRFTFGFQPVRNARFTDSHGSYPMNLLYELSGAPTNSHPANAVILTGAICIEMPPPEAVSPPTPTLGQKP